MRLKWKPWSLTLAILIAFPLTALATAPESTTEFVLDLWFAPKYDRQVKKCKDDFEKMDAEGRLVMNRISVKEALVNDILAGRRTLVDVAHRFEWLNRDQPAIQDSIRVHFPHAKVEELAARNVMQYVESRLHSNGKQSHDVMARLEAEFQKAYPQISKE